MRRLSLFIMTELVMGTFASNAFADFDPRSGAARRRSVRSGRHWPAQSGRSAGAVARFGAKTDARVANRGGSTTLQRIIHAQPVHDDAGVCPAHGKSRLVTGLGIVHRRHADFRNRI